MLSMTEGDRDRLEVGWCELLDKYDALDAATLIAWVALLDAYKANAKGHVVPTAQPLAAYEKAKALRIAAEQALLSFMQQYGVRPASSG
ncbi:MAG TPA: hypothetical protein VFU71_13005 [Burkholderiaceae bacterium]|nr:hypothetical protein [Burkholderiaceae bacterium]